MQGLSSMRAYDACCGTRGDRIRDSAQEEFGADAAAVRPHHLRPADHGRAGVHPRMRITVATVLDQLAAGASVDEVLADYPYLERDDINQALAYAGSLAREDVVPA